MQRERWRLLTEIALSIALAVVLNAIKLWQMPQGGSIALGMLPIMVLALRRGLMPGLAAGVLYGFLDYLVNPYPPVHPIQFVLDYPIPYLLVGLAGIGAKRWRKAVEGSFELTAVWTVILPSILLAALGRYASHWLSGVVYFGAYAPPGQPVWLYSAIYNSYVLISAAGCFAAAAIVLPALERALPTRAVTT